jgi:thioredoxin-dependent peroxiredoxin
MEMAEVNEKAPDFKLMGSDGKEYSLKRFSGKYLVLYFYPRDDTPGCTTEAKGFTKDLDDIRKLGAEVVGVSNDDLAAHAKFCSKYGLRHLLLSDKGNEMIKSYGAYGDKGIFGWGTLRKTFIIDKKGKIIKIFEKVKPDGHEKEVAEFLKSLA